MYGRRRDMYENLHHAWVQSPFNELIKVWIMCVVCHLCSLMFELHNSVYTCQDRKPSLTHCLLVRKHIITKVSVLTVMVAKRNAISM